MHNRGISKLAATLTKHMSEQLATPDVLELGTIQSDMSLLPDLFSHPIPQGDYLLCRILTLPDPMVTTSPGGTDNHTHTVPRPAALAPLTAGDRVLIAWVGGGNQAIILDVVVT